MRYLGIDYGTKRTGLSLSDESGSLAFPHSIIDMGEEAISAIAALITQESVGTAVLGESKDFGGVPNPVMKHIEAFKKAIEQRTGIAVVYEPEFMTSAQASRPAEGVQRPTASPSAQVPQGPLDASAATLILQGYLDRMRNTQS